MKYSGKTNINQFFEDIEIKYRLQPQSHFTDRQKTIVAIDHLEGAVDNVTSDAPKEWARLELRMFPELKDNLIAFAQRLRARYQNLALRQRKVYERQEFRQEKNTAQLYKQRFELLCYETDYPKQVWGAEFYQGFAVPIKDKLAGVAYIDFDNYEIVAQLAVQFDENFHMRKLQEIIDYSSQELPYRPSERYQSSSHFS
ncbi:Bgt-20179 [Blumeria graminis f. sp. tritici]|uniref:Bgt-20179 n=2 Tax=Blumeria graminis f. sp. tritici TaxID=62690 RepID=A0A381L3C3_BLUGR|nr:Bgt-20179 [Blumeria graminis f. sp. tritici]